MSVVQSTVDISLLLSPLSLSTNKPLSFLYHFFFFIYILYLLAFLMSLTRNFLVEMLIVYHSHIYFTIKLLNLLLLLLYDYYFVR